MQQQKNKQRGFTLLEVMVVLAIIGGIMALVATNVIGSASDARVDTINSKIKLIQNALYLDQFDNYTYPTTEQELDALIKKPTNSPEPRNYRPEGYLKSNNVPTDAWANEFLYFLDKNRYEIISLGADGQEGGDEDAADISSLDL